MFIRRLSTVATLVVLAFASTSLAQPSPAASTTAGTWEVEGHGGWFGASDVTSGTPIGTFPRGATIPSLSTFTSRAVSSWFYGDGSVLVAEVFSLSGRTQRIAPLDNVLRQRLAKREGGGSFGFRVSRHLTSRFSVEFNVDRVSSPLDLVSGVESALEAARSSFVEVFLRQFPSGEVASTFTVDRGGNYSQRFVTGAVNYHVGTFGHLAPYVSGGLGGVFNDGDAPSATLVGNYRLAELPRFELDETDTVTLHAVPKGRALVVLAGGGARFHVSPRHGVRADVRLHFAENPIHTTVDARPVRSPGGTASAIFVVVVQPTLQFGSGPAPQVQSSLSGPAVTGLETFTGTGTQVQVNFSIGYFFRF